MGFLYWFVVLFAVPSLVTLFTLASLNKSLGLRRKIVQWLLVVFEKGKQRIEKSQLKSRPSEDDDDIIEPTYEDRDGPAPDFRFMDSFELVTGGIQAIVQDQVTHRFEAEEIQSWNLLTRTNQGYEFISYRLTAIWVVGFYFRYVILLPIRILILIVGTLTLTVLTGLVGITPNIFGIRKKCNEFACKVSFRILSRAFSAIITYHNQEYKPNSNGICVANHTSPIDVVLLSCDASYSLIGQSQGGFLGILQRALARASSHIWFERSEMKDRLAVSRRLKEHAQDPTKSPILIFPEGTCINNSAVMQFKKGSFEVGSVIYPVAIKYDPRFGDAFWNSSEYGMLHYIYRMMTSWAIVCEIWYLPPMYRKEGESAISFANRVKAEIAHQGGLVDLDWDGQLKRAPVKKEWKQQQQLEYSKKFATPDSEQEDDNHSMPTPIINGNGAVHSKIE